MTTLTRLEQWKDRGVISPEQYTLLGGLARGEPSSVFLELNALLYLGILAFVGGLGWTISTWSQQLGDLLVITLLAAMLGVCGWYCSSRAPAWSPMEVQSPSLAFDYVLYLGGLIWSLELAYLENRFHLLEAQWDLYLLLTAGVFFFVAYRFDNRFLLSLALSSLAGWFGLTISHLPSHQDAPYRQYAILYSVTIGGIGFLLHRYRLKPHFFGTYLNLAANVLFWAVLSGVFQREDHGLWFLALLIACGAALAWGLFSRQFAFVAYAAVYGYIGVSSILIRDIHEGIGVLTYFVLTGIAMVVILLQIARRFGREA